MPMLAFETILCSFALAKGYQIWRSKAQLGHGTPVLEQIINDSVLYFIACVSQTSSSPPY